MPCASKWRGGSDIARYLAWLVLLTACPVGALAQQSHGIEVTPFGGYRFGGTFDVDGQDATWKLSDASSFGLLLNMRHRANTQWELLYSEQRTDARLNADLGVVPNVDIDLRTLQLGGTYLGEGERFRPYLAATIGGTRISNASVSDTFFSGSIGVGLQVLPASRVGIRIEARAHGALTDSSTDLFCRTGPDQNICAIRVDGSVLGQLETFAGIVFRF